MIAENLLYVAVFVFILLSIGLALTVMEFSIGEPSRLKAAVGSDGGNESTGG
ncbi:MAG: hypothetical protein HOG25_02655 [Gammaproteobacteria bacterium]|nr:hypothetical protein [Gammaproteobacteria bacterium]